jgi:Adenylate and Guanylate cyclase catalytic domain
LRMGIGLHLGPAILGEMGHGRARSLTAIGDTVNLASRLEALAKELGCQLVVSDAVAEHAAEALADLPCRETEVRGRAGRLGVRLIADAASLPPLAPPGTARATGYRQRWRARLRLVLDRAGPEGSKIAATAPSAPDGRPAAR